ncbi:MAG: ribonuclease HII [Candidatus Kryptoniota bacterium]
MQDCGILTFERMIHEGGIKLIAAVDEAGRGPVAGPVTAAAVILPFDSFISGVTDSKKISGKMREELVAKIYQVALDYSIAHVDNETIDRINILNATRLAVRRAVEALKIRPQIILIDGKFLNVQGYSCISVVKGDQHVYSISAASIIAKTARDNLMKEYSIDYPKYRFDKNKGYLTTEHLLAISLYGLSPIHRRSFRYSIPGKEINL